MCGITWITVAASVLAAFISFATLYRSVSTSIREQAGKFAVWITDDQLMSDFEVRWLNTSGLPVFDVEITVPETKIRASIGIVVPTKDESETFPAINEFLKNEMIKAIPGYEDMPLVEKVRTLFGKGLQKIRPMETVFRDMNGRQWRRKLDTGKLSRSDLLIMRRRHRRSEAPTCSGRGATTTTYGSPNA